MTTLSTLPQDLEATRPLTRSEQLAQCATAKVIIREALAYGGFDPGIAAQIAVKSNDRFTARMGDARNTNPYATLPSGVIRLSASALWRRATPEKRRNTVIHELAHIIANHRSPRAGHGVAWKATMRRLGEVPKRTHTVNRNGLRRNTGRVVDPQATVHSFQRGDEVVFVSRKRETIRAKVVKRNRKTVEVREIGGQRA